MQNTDHKNTIEFCRERMSALEKSGNMMVLSDASLHHLQYLMQSEIAKIMFEHVLPLKDENTELHNRIRRLEQIILTAFSLEKIPTSLS